jgi:lysophospholipase L1-like esterase
MLSLLLALLLAGCSLDDPADPTDQVNDPTTADASTPYVAIGNSLTAGFMDSGLMKAGQANSYPMIVATQMGLNKDTFTQPWIEAPGIGTTNVGEGNVSGVLHFNGTTVLPLAVTPQAEVSGLLLAVAQPTQYHNLGVPGAFSHDLMNAHSAATSHAAAPPFSSPNTFFEFINRAGDLVSLFKNIEVPANPPAPGYQSGSQFYQTIAKGPALVTAWVGGNDFLFGATSGEPMPGSPYNALITPAPEFAANYGAFLGSLAGGLNGRNGFPATIIGATLPLVRNIAYFLDRETFDEVFGPLQLIYEEPDAEYILFTDFISTDLPTTPGGTILSAMTLDNAEVNYLDTEVIGPYNAAIVGTMGQITGNPGATIDELPLVDFNAAMDALRAADQDAARHFLFLRITHPTDTIAETAARTYFALDGVHPNNKGYAFVANSFLAKINEVTGSSWAQVPVDAFIWDPTYGVPIPTTAVQGGIPKISPEVAAAMRAIFR